MSLCRQFIRAPRLLSQCQRLSVLTQQKCHESTGDDQMRLTFASPGQVYYNDQVVRQVDVPTLDGVFGILAKHVPTIGALKPGVVTVFDDEKATGKKVFVSSGTVTVNGDSTVQILAEEAFTLDKFDAKDVSQTMNEYNSALGSAKSEEEKAEIQVALECLEELSKAVATA